MLKKNGTYFHKHVPSTKNYEKNYIVELVGFLDINATAL